MKHLTRSHIDALDRRFRANLINSVSGYKPANLIGTLFPSGATNLAIFSSVVHIGADPPLLGFIMRPVGAEAERHTYENIKASGVYTINHVHESFATRAHWTSAKFARGESEFEKCGLREEFIEDFRAPFVKESRVKLGLRFLEEIPIEINRTILVIGAVEHLVVPDEALLENGNLDLNSVADVCVSGLGAYHRVEQIAALPYAKPENLPDFEK